MMLYFQRCQECKRGRMMIMIMVMIEVEVDDEERGKAVFPPRHDDLIPRRLKTISFPPVGVSFSWIDLKYGMVITILCR